MNYLIFLQIKTSVLYKSFVKLINKLSLVTRPTLSTHVPLTKGTMGVDQFNYHGTSTMDQQGRVTILMGWMTLKRWRMTRACPSRQHCGIGLRTWALSWARALVQPSEPSMDNLSVMVQTPTLFKLALTTIPNTAPNSVLILVITLIAN